MHTSRTIQNKSQNPRLTVKTQSITSPIKKVKSYTYNKSKNRTQSSTYARQTEAYTYDNDGLLISSGAYT
ncbi:MAG: hypothetical protein Q9M36_06700 [Sulfurovum sp.]|nr:hypothetical protein [Sulfurovum sp.]